MKWMQWLRGESRRDETEPAQDIFEAKPEVTPTHDGALAWGELRSMLAMRTQKLEHAHLQKLGQDFMTLTQNLQPSQRAEMSQHVRSWLTQSTLDHSRLLHPKMLGELQQHTSLLEIARAQAYHPLFWANASFVTNRNHRDLEWLARHASVGMEHASCTIALALFETNASHVDALGFLEMLGPRAVYILNFDPRAPLVFEASRLFDTSRLERLLISDLKAPHSEIDPILRAHLDDRLFQLGIRDAYRRRSRYAISFPDRLWFDELTGDILPPPPPRPWLDEDLFDASPSIRHVHVKRLDIKIWSLLASQEWWPKVTHLYAHEVVICDRVVGSPSLMDLVLDHCWPPNATLTVYDEETVTDLIALALDGMLAPSDLSIVCKTGLSARRMEIASTIGSDASVSFEFFPFDHESRWDRY